MPAVPDDFNNIFDAIIGDKHGPRTLLVHGSAFQGDGGGATYAAAFGCVVLGGTSVAPVPLRDGDCVTEIRVFVQDNATGPTKIQASFDPGDMHGTSPVPIASSNVSAGDGTDQTLTISPPPGTVLAKGTSYCIQITPSTGDGSCRIYAIEIDLYHP